MLQRFQDRVGTAGLIVAIVALVLALAGGAYAASGALTGKQKKEVEKIAKKYAGKPGANGTNGAAGATGPAGAKGDAGAKGEKGDAGTAGTGGTPGANGKSVEAIPVPVGQTECAGNGGAVYEVEGSGEAAEICNGSPWTVGSLPKGKTETGVWTIGTEISASPAAYAPISFNVPLASSVGMSVHFINVHEEEEAFSEPEGPKPAACPGTAAAPSALPGTLCVYETTRSADPLAGNGLGFELTSGGVKTVGSVLVFKAEPNSFAIGTWAVTAPTS
jgi:hypothetical protein